MLGEVMLNETARKILGGIFFLYFVIVFITLIFSEFRMPPIIQVFVAIVAVILGIDARKMKKTK